MWEGEGRCKLEADWSWSGRNGGMTGQGGAGRGGAEWNRAVQSKTKHAAQYKALHEALQSIR